MPDINQAVSQVIKVTTQAARKPEQKHMSHAQQRAYF